MLRVIQGGFEVTNEEYMYDYISFYTCMNFPK